MCFVCWINKAINMYSVYVIVIGFFTPTVVRRKGFNVKVYRYIAYLDTIFKPRGLPDGD